MMLNVFNRRCLRDIMGVSWKDKQRSAGFRDLQDTVANRQKRFIGHVLRLPTSRPASLVIDWILEERSRRWGRPKRTWRDTFIEDMQEIGVSGSDTRGEVKIVASDHVRWTQLVAQCSSRYRTHKSK